jgi:hypothetical protein
MLGKVYWNPIDPTDIATTPIASTSKSMDSPRFALVNPATSPRSS